MSSREYESDFKNVNWSTFDKKVWKDPTKTGPSPKSYKKLILIKNKHSKKDVQVTFGEWVPRNGYKKGDFFQGKIKLKKSDIYLYRELDFLDVK